MTCKTKREAYAKQIADSNVMIHKFTMACTDDSRC
jgi:hypothetical protein